MLLRGDPGIGKSRFVEEVRSEIFDDGTEVLVARCTPIAANTAFHPILELISRRLGFATATPEMRAASLARRMEELGFVPVETVPLIASLFSLPLDPAKWPASNLTPAVARRLTMDILLDWVHVATRYSPLLFIIEDLHWADPSTVELLDHLIRSQRSARLLVLSTARPEFKPTWASAASVTQIELEALDTEEVEILIRKVASDKALPPAVVWQIRERASGNPLFLEEITRTILELGSVRRPRELVGNRRHNGRRRGARLDASIPRGPHRPTRRGPVAVPTRRGDRTGILPGLAGGRRANYPRKP